MDIADAFTEEAIATTDVNVGGDEEDELREMIRQIYQTNTVDPDRDHENIAVLCFVAGRAYQADSGITHIPIPIEMVTPFMEFLAQRGVT